MIKKALYSKRSVRLFFMIFLLFPTINFITNTKRPTRIYYKIKTFYLQLVGAFHSIIGSLSSNVFSLIGDKTKFKYICWFFSGILAIISFTFHLSFVL